MSAAKIRLTWPGTRTKDLTGQFQLGSVKSAGVMITSPSKIYILPPANLTEPFLPPPPKGCSRGGTITGNIVIII